MHQKRNRKMVSRDLASFPIKKECKNLMPHWCSEHQGSRSLGSEPHENRRPSVTMPAPASARDDDSGRQHTVISKRDTNRKTLHRIRHFDESGAEWRNHIPQMTGTSPHPSSFRPKRSGVGKSHSLMVHRTLGQEISRLCTTTEPKSLCFNTGPCLRWR